MPQDAADSLQARRHGWALRAALLAGLIAVSVLYLPLNHSLRDGTVLYTGLDRDLPLAPALAAPYLIFLPIWWLAVLWAALTDRRQWAWPTFSIGTFGHAYPSHQAIALVACLRLHPHRALRHTGADPEEALATSRRGFS